MDLLNTDTVARIRILIPNLPILNISLSSCHSGGGRNCSLFGAVCPTF